MSNRIVIATELVLATNNLGKLKELQQLLTPLQIDVLPVGHFSSVSPEETGLSFVENAIIKARHACQASGLPALADDSGLVVDALGGAPGIYSARFAGANASDDENNQLLLEKLRSVPTPARSARFVCAMALMRSTDDPCPLICTGTWEGRIAEAPSGTEGFGYDPIFELPGRDRTAAQLAPIVKNRHSHRGDALRQLIQRIDVRS